MRFPISLVLVSIAVLLAAQPVSASVDQITNRFESPEAVAEPGEIATDTQFCHDDEKLVGGGAWTGSGRMILTSSAPGPAGKAWVARAYNTGEIAGDLRAEAFCAGDRRHDRVRGIVVRRETLASTPSDDPYHDFNHEATGLAECGEQARIVGGGTMTGATDSYLSQGYPEVASHTVRYWRGDAVGDSAFDLTVFAFCARRSGRDRVAHITRRTGRSVEIAPGSSESASARCRRGERLVSGGARSTGAGAGSTFLQSSAPGTERAGRWVARAALGAASPGARLTAYAYCARG